MSGIEVKAPEDVTSREDFISCEPYSCRLKAAACVGRRSLVMARNQTMSACFNCPVGPVVEKNSGGALPSAVLERAAKSPGFNWGFQGFARGLAKSKAKAKSAPVVVKSTPKKKSQFIANLNTAKRLPAPPPLTAQEKEMNECKKCNRQLRKRRLDTPVPVGTEGLCNECRRKITRRKPSPQIGPALLEPEPAAAAEPKSAKILKPKTKPKKKKKHGPPPASGILKAREPEVRTAAYVARASADDRTLAELKEAIDLVDAIGWDEARALARRFQFQQGARPLRSVSL
jgi:hypothetical protein